MNSLKDTLIRVDIRGNNNKSISEEKKNIKLTYSCKRVRTLFRLKDNSSALLFASPFMGEIRMAQTLICQAILFAYKGESAQALRIIKKMDTGDNSGGGQKNAKLSRIRLHGAAGVHEWFLERDDAVSACNLENAVPRMVRDVLIAQRLIHHLNGQRPIDRNAYFSKVRREITDLAIQQDALYAGAMIYQQQTGEYVKAIEISQKISKPLILDMAKRYLSHAQTS